MQIKKNEMTTTLYSWLLLAKISHLLVGNFTPFQKFMNFLDDIINRVCENSELPNICGEKTKVVDNFYLRLRNEFQPFPAKNQAIDWLTKPSRSTNYRPGILAGNGWN